MDIKIQTEFNGFLATNNSAIALRCFKVIDQDNNKLGFISGGDLENQLKEFGFEIKRIKNDIKEI